MAPKKFIILFLCALNIQCFSFFGDKCSEGLFELKPNIGNYEFTPIPEMTVSLNDTIWIKPNDYSRSYNSCDYGYGEFFPTLAITNPELIKPIKIDDYFGFIPRKKGTSAVQIIGEISLRRNDEDIQVHESMDFSIIVTNPTEKETNHPVPGDLTKPFFTIDNILVTPTGTQGVVELEFKTTPNLQDRSFRNNSRIDVTLVTSDYFDKSDPEASGYFDEFSTGNIDFEWDSLSTVLLGFIRVANPFAWDESKGEFKEGINKSTSRFFGIKNYPANVPFKDRNFEIIALN